VNFYQTSLCHTPKDSTLHTRLCESITSKKLIVFCGRFDDLTAVTMKNANVSAVTADVFFRIEE
jgi:hypothetical protein